jgi:hypothetical protein
MSDLISVTQLPRHPYLADQISSAYDCFLEIQRYVQKQHHGALVRSEGWEQENVCAPCLYKTTGEPSLRFSFLAAMDGNNSLKLVDSTFRSGSERTDNRATSSKRWISPEDVNIFKDEVNKSNKKVSYHFPH